MQRLRGASPAMTLERLRERLVPVPAGRCMLGLSGGADSVGLLCLLLPLRREGGLELEAVHVNHGLRGTESEEDERFVRELCKEESVPLQVFRPDLAGRRDENTAREARYRAFREAMTARNISTMVLAHQREDQAETFLLRLLRGAGPEGLTAMRAREEREGYTLLRPMLDISGTELREALREAGRGWREDGSNRDERYLRNRVRLELIPLMEEMIPGAAGRLARTAGLVALENEAMAGAAAKMLEDSETPAGLRAEPLLRAPEALACRTLRLWWRLRGPALPEHELNYEQTRRLWELAAAPRGTIINLPGGWRARREKEAIRLLPPGDRTRNNRPPRRKEGKTDD